MARRCNPLLAGQHTTIANKEKVRLKALLLSGETQLKQMAIPLFLGKDASGKALITDLAAMQGKCGESDSPARKGFLEASKHR